MGTHEWKGYRTESDEVKIYCKVMNYNRVKIGIVRVEIKYLFNAKYSDLS